MMMEHILKKILQLVIDDQEGTEDAETMPNKEDIDRNVEEILKMLHREVNDPTSSEKSSDKSELASRIDNFHKGFRAVHGRYYHLMGELKKILQPICIGNGNLSCEGHQILQSQLETSREETNACMTERKKLTDEPAERNEVNNQMLSFDEILSSYNALDHCRILIHLNGAFAAENKKQSGLIGQLRTDKEVLRSGNVEFVRRIRKAEKANLELKLVHENLRSQNSKLKAESRLLRGEDSKLRSINNKLKQELEARVAETEARALEMNTLSLELGWKKMLSLKEIDQLEAELTALKADHSRELASGNSTVMREKLAEKKKELADEYEKKKEGIREMILKFNHLRDDCDNISTYLSRYNEFCTILSSSDYV